MSDPALIGLISGLFGGIGSTLAWEIALRPRREHRRDLRMLRRDIRYSMVFSKPFDYGDHGPRSDYIPRPPELTAGFVDILYRIEFHLTDQHCDDNSGEGLLSLVTGYEQLKEYNRMVNSFFIELKETVDPIQRQAIKDNICTTAAEYDKMLRMARFIAEDALRDIDRRLKELSPLRQLKRMLTSLPKGENPPDLTRDDPRLQQGSTT